jgi:photosystem II stability/assembly factor-like uncharacterized protein
MAEAFPPRPRWLGLTIWIAVGALVAAGAFLLAKTQAEQGSTQVAPPPRGLPHTPDYHALLVSLDTPNRLLLGTHAGLYESRDAGVRWRKGPLARKDVINLVRTQDRVVWAAGHNVLFRSVDGGRTWHEEHPSGLPSRDLHGFASDPRQANTLYAAVARHGLYRSRDGGRSYAEVTSEVGGNVFGLAVLASGRLLAADAEVGLLASDYGGQRWHRVLAPPVVGVAVDPEQPRTVLASGRGIFRSRDGGMHWRRVFVPPEGVGGDPDPSAPPRAWETDRGSGPWREPPERGFPPIRPLPSVTPFQSVRRRAYTAMSRYSAF